MTQARNHKDIFNETSGKTGHIALDDFVERVCRPVAAPAAPSAITSQQINRFEALGRAVSEVFGEPVVVHAVGSHVSKSVILPVAEIVLPHGFGRIVLRDNFYDTKITFELACSLPADTFGVVGLFDRDRKINAVYCEGFDEKRVYGPFSENRARFTVETGVLQKNAPLDLISQVCRVLKSLTPAPMKAKLTADKKYKL